MYYLAAVENRNDYLDHFKKLYTDLALTSDFVSQNRNLMNKTRLGMTYRPRKMNSVLKDDVLNIVNKEIEKKNNDNFYLVNPDIERPWLENNNEEMSSKDVYRTVLAPNYESKEPIIIPYYLNQKKYKNMIKDLDEDKNSMLDERAKEVFNEIVFGNYELDDYESEDSDYYDEMEGGSNETEFIKFGIKIIEPVTLNDVINKMYKKNRPFVNETQLNYDKRIESMSRLMYKLLPTQLKKEKIEIDEKLEVARIIVRDPELYKLFMLQNIINKQIKKNNKRVSNKKVEIERNILDNLLKNKDVTERTEEDILTSYMKNKLEQNSISYSLVALKRLIRDNPSLANSELTLSQLMALDEKRKLAKSRAKDKKLKMKIIAENPVLISKLKNEIKNANPNIQDVPIETLLNIPIETYEAESRIIEKDKNKFLEQFPEKLENISFDVRNLTDFMNIVTGPSIKTIKNENESVPGKTGDQPGVISEISTQVSENFNDLMDFAKDEEENDTKTNTIEITSNYVDDIFNKRIQSRINNVEKMGNPSQKIRMLHRSKYSLMDLRNKLIANISSDDEELKDKIDKKYFKSLLELQKGLKTIYDEEKKSGKIDELNKQLEEYNPSIDPKSYEDILSRGTVLSLNSQDLIFGDTFKGDLQPISNILKPARSENFKSNVEWLLRGNYDQELENTIKNTVSKLMDQDTKDIITTGIQQNNNGSIVYNQLKEAKQFIDNVANKKIILKDFTDLYRLNRYKRVIEFLKGTDKLPEEYMKGEKKSQNREQMIDELKSNIFNIGDVKELYVTGKSAGIKGIKDLKFDPDLLNKINKTNIGTLNDEKLTDLVKLTGKILAIKDFSLTAEQRKNIISSQESRAVEKENKREIIKSFLEDKKNLEDKINSLDESSREELLNGLKNLKLIDEYGNPDSSVIKQFNIMDIEKALKEINNFDIKYKELYNEKIRQMGPIEFVNELAKKRIITTKDFGNFSNTMAILKDAELDDDLYRYMDKNIDIYKNNPAEEINKALDTVIGDINKKFININYKTNPEGYNKKLSLLLSKYNSGEKLRDILEKYNKIEKTVILAKPSNDPKEKNNGLTIGEDLIKILEKGKIDEFDEKIEKVVKEHDILKDKKADDNVLNDILAKTYKGEIITESEKPEESLELGESKPEKSKEQEDKEENLQRLKETGKEVKDGANSGSLKPKAKPKPKAKAKGRPKAKPKEKNV